MEGPADRQSAHVIQPSRIPEQSAHAIEVPLLAWVIPKEDQTCTGLEAPSVQAGEAVGLFLSGDSPLPRSIDRGA